MLRAVVGGRELDTLLAAKDAVAIEAAELLANRARDLGLEMVALGTRDLILPGDMKELMNKVTEAKKAAEANLIVRREETAAMRSQANTARLMQDSPILMRLKELEVLEKVAANGPVAVQAVLRALRATECLPEREAMKIDSEIGMPVFMSDDAKEGPLAFMEKRKPDFKGR